MRIYDIHPTDGTVIEPAGREAPVDTMRGEPRIPAGSTSIEPPETGEYEATRWAGNTWEVVPDWRGHVYWLVDGSLHEITELGVEPPTDALDEAPPEALGELVYRKRTEIANARKQAEAQGVQVNSIRYSGDPENRQAIREALEGAEDSDAEYFIRWKDSDGNFHVNHPTADVWAALHSILTRRSQLIRSEGEIVDKVEAILASEQLDHEEKRMGIEAIHWT